MATHFHRLKIQELRRETPSTVSINFELPAEQANTFSYQAGQYLTLRATIAGEDVRRSYSLCSSPGDGELRVAVKEVAGGKFSTWANRELLPGTELELMSPMGNFVASSQTGHHVAFAAGSGITPVISILRQVLAASTDNRFTLFYGNKTHDEIIFKTELDALAARYGDRLSIAYTLSQEQRSGFGFGRLDAARLSSAIQQGFSLDQLAASYLCGPSEMIFSVQAELEQRGVSSDKIYFELFTTPDAVAADTSSDAPAAPAPVAGSAGLTATFIMDGDRVEVPIKNNEQTILDIGLAAGIDLPFACQGGVCCTCRAKVTSGKVDMRQNFSLGDSEISDGYVLTCQSFPDGESATLDYDS